MLALMAAGFAVSSALRPRGEEADGRLEGLLATGLTRHAMGRHLPGGDRRRHRRGRRRRRPRARRSATGWSPVTARRSAASSAPPCRTSHRCSCSPPSPGWPTGSRRGWAGFGWVALAFCVVVSFFGELLQLPDWVVDLSPFSHLALVPAEPLAWGPLLALFARRRRPRRGRHRRPGAPGHALTPSRPGPPRVGQGDSRARPRIDTCRTPRDIRRRAGGETRRRSRRHPRVGRAGTRGGRGSFSRQVPWPGRWPLSLGLWDQVARRTSRTTRRSPRPR